MIRPSSERLLGALADHFKKDAFLPNQEEGVRALLSDLDVYVNIRTGGGKSLIYQLSALLMPGFTIVVSPLIALMIDQLESLKSLGISIAVLNSTQDRFEASRNRNLIRKGESKLLYVSPERYCTDEFLNFIQSLADSGIKVDRVVVDEAHCASMWGHDFRPDYMRLKDLRDRIGNPPFAAVTATASVRVRDDMFKVLGLRNPLQIIGDMDRPNLKLVNTPCEGADERNALLLDRLRGHAKRKEVGIVYCSRIKLAEELRDFASAGRIRAGLYHAQMETEDRSKAQSCFGNNGYDAIFATKALGMGIDKKDVRFVYHAQVPDSLEALWQEIGRSGRDGNPAHCELLFSRYDVRLRHQFLNAQNPDVPFIRRIYDTVCRFIPEPERDLPAPVFTFRRQWWIESYARDNAYLASSAGAALASLQEHGLFSFQGNRATRHISPKQIEENGFPITAELVDLKRVVEEQQAMVMTHYAFLNTGLRETIFRHFISNSVVEEVLRDQSRGTWLGMREQPFLKQLLRIAAEEDLDGSKFREKLAAAIRKEAGKQVRPNEAGMDIEQAQNTGHLKSIASGSRTFLTVTTLGLDRLQEFGISPSPILNWASFKKRSFSPMARQIVLNAISDWFTQATEGKAATDDWWDTVKAFYQTSFVVLDETVRGDELVRACYRVAAKAVQGGNQLWLRFGKQLLEELFPERFQNSEKPES